MIKIYSLLIALSMFVGLANAQNDPNAKKILDQLSAKIKTFKGVKADFNYVTKSRSSKTTGNVKGTVLIKDQKYYIKQGSTEIFCDGSKVWNYNGDNEVTITPADDSKALTPQKLLTNFYDKDFSYRLISSAGASHEIELTPIDKRKNFQKVSLFVDKAKTMVTKARILDKSSNTIEFSLTNIQTNASIPDATFVFNKAKYKKNIEVIE